MSVAFVMFTRKEQRATEFCLETVRKWYPNEPIYMFENESSVCSEVAKNKNAFYFQQPVNYMKPRSHTKYAAFDSIEGVSIYVNQWRTAISGIDADWIILLEPDVIIRNRVESFPAASMGGHLHTFNGFHSSVNENINAKRTRNKVEEYIFSAAGGNVMRVDALKKIFHDDTWQNHVRDVFKHVHHCDVILSYLFYINDFDIEDWPGYCELHQTKDTLRHTMAPIVHGFKHFYDETFIKYGKRGHNLVACTQKFLTHGMGGFIPSGDLMRYEVVGTDPVRNVEKDILIGETVLGSSQCARISKSGEVSVIEDPLPAAVKRLEGLHRRIVQLPSEHLDEYMEQVMTCMHLTGDETVLEIGGNIGRNTVVLGQIMKEANKGGSIVTLESLQKEASQLSTLVKQNGLPVQVIAAALSKHPLVQKDWIAKKKGTRGTEEWTEVPTISLEDLTQNGKIVFDVLVIDCEGAFEQILCDWPSLLNSVKLIQIENDFGSQESANRVLSMIENAGFEVFFSAPLTINMRFPMKHQFYQIYKRMSGAIHPISFSIPAEKIVDFIPNKNKLMAHVVPGDLSTYIFKTESEYYKDYQQSHFARTKKKAGFDCLRHLEILANGCIPLFEDIDEIPTNTMTHYPLHILKQIYAEDLVNNFDRKRYRSYVYQLLDWTRKNLTCESMARYILQQTGKHDVKKVLFLSEGGPDYLRCLTLIGFKQLFGSECYDHPPVRHIYKDFPEEEVGNLYGMGFTYSRVVDTNQKVREDLDILQMIRSRYFDVVVYGSVHRSKLYMKDVCEYYGSNEIILLCGEDIHGACALDDCEKGCKFKREN